jgi:hypothetical protein
MVPIKKQGKRLATRRRVCSATRPKRKNLDESVTSFGERCSSNVFSRAGQGGQKRRASNIGGQQEPRRWEELRKTDG